jgi:U11/U12 small nuclear ribonucleoprotein SNRNP65
MKGQAFITLPNVDRAKEALNDTNWVMLQGKPLVVHFARSAQANTTGSTT